MGGKGGGGPKPPPVEQAPEPDMTPMLAMMNQMMSVMSQMQMPPLPQTPPVPPIASAPDYDFGNKINQLRQRMSTDYNNLKTQQKGRLDTIHTSSLLDEEDVSTTNASLIGGSGNQSG